MQAETIEGVKMVQRFLFIHEGDQLQNRENAAN